MYIKVKYHKKNTDPLMPENYGPNEYTYQVDEAVEVGDFVTVDQRGKSVKVLVSVINYDFDPESVRYAIKRASGKVDL